MNSARTLAICISMFCISSGVAVGRLERPIEHEAISVKDAAIVGFLPPTSDPFWSRSGAREHEFHVFSALADAKACLDRKGVDVVLVRADVIDVKQGEVSVSLSAKKDSPSGIGAYLLNSASPPKLLSCSNGSSPLQVIIPVVAAQYFGFPECVPEEWRGQQVNDKC